MGYLRVGSTFSSFNPCPSLRSSAPDDRKQFQYINIVLNNKPKPLFLEFILSEEKFYLFKNISNSLTEPLQRKWGINQGFWETAHLPLP